MPELSDDDSAGDTLLHSPTMPRLSAASDAQYSACEYLAAAEYLDQIKPDECHPALFERRQVIAIRLRRMAHDSPDEIVSRRVLDGIRFLCYRLRR